MALPGCSLEKLANLFSLSCTRTSSEIVKKGGRDGAGVRDWGGPMVWYKAFFLQIWNCALNYRYRWLTTLNRWTALNVVRHAWKYSGKKLKCMPNFWHRGGGGKVWSREGGQQVEREWSNFNYAIHCSCQLSGLEMEFPPWAVLLSKSVGRGTFAGGVELSWEEMRCRNHQLRWTDGGREADAEAGKWRRWRFRHIALRPQRIDLHANIRTVKFNNT